jgi:hypothetical protein
LAGWGYQATWIGLGRIVAGAGTRPVVVFAPRPDPAFAGLLEGAPWAERLRVITGAEPAEHPAVDWAATEAALGTALPEDYKEIVDLFGPGGFDEYLDLIVPGGSGTDLVRFSEIDAAHSVSLWAPYPVYPARNGLLRWGTSEYELDLVWQTGAADPADWPVLVREAPGEEWRRFDCGMGEFLARLLTDVSFGFPPSLLDSHFFESSGGGQSGGC